MRCMPFICALMACTGSADDTSSSDTAADTGSDSGSDTGADSGMDTADPCFDWQAEGVVTPNCGPAPLTVSGDGEAVVEDSAHEDDQWDWGDGTVDPGLNGTHTYAEPGDYVVTFSTRMVVGETLVDVDLTDIRVRVY